MLNTGKDRPKFSETTFCIAPDMKADTPTGAGERINDAPKRLRTTNSQFWVVVPIAQFRNVARKRNPMNPATAKIRLRRAKLRRAAAEASERNGHTMFVSWERRPRLIERLNRIAGVSPSSFIIEMTDLFFEQHNVGARMLAGRSAKFATRRAHVDRRIASSDLHPRSPHFHVK